MRICLVCPECGNRTWKRCGGGFKCAACGEILEDTNEMPAVVVDDNEREHNKGEAGT